MAGLRDEKFYELVEKRKNELYDELYKDKFCQVYMITYAETGNGEQAEALAAEEAEDYAEHMLDVMEPEIEEDIEEMLNDAGEKKES